MQAADNHLDELLVYLKRSRSFDFSGYKRASLIRRINKRMQDVGIETYEGYIDYLEAQPDEFTQLFNTILINVTGFFRDPEAWDYLSQQVLPRIIKTKKQDAPIRIWCAGVASGEEAYTSAILFCEAMGERVFREQVKIYATDLDEEALTKARQAIFSRKEVEAIPLHLLEKYFERVDNQFVFRKDFRRLIIFGKHDLIQDAPISRIDLLICRNTLMYFNSETQQKIISRLHFALNESGILFLGKAEMLLSYTSTFNPVDLKWRIFSKVSRANQRDRLYMAPQPGNAGRGNHLENLVLIRDAAFENVPVAQIIVDNQGVMVLANERARSMFNISMQDFGRPFKDIAISYRPVELRSAIEQTYAQRSPVIFKDIQWYSSDGARKILEIQVCQLQDTQGNMLGATIIFNDITYYKQLQHQLEHTNEELETAMEELQSTNEELETTNEELQSTIEELETTNEELQSTNEELETMNEELQSTNEELETMNEELNHRTGELNQVNVFLESILTNLGGGVVVLDSDLRVQVWNHASEDLWGLRSEEVQGKYFLNLDIGLPVERLKHPIHDCLSQSNKREQIIVEAKNRRGKTFDCLVTCTAMDFPGIDNCGAILIMEEDGTKT